MYRTKDFHWIQILLHRLYNKEERGQQPDPRSYVMKMEKNQNFFFGSNGNLLFFPVISTTKHGQKGGELGFSVQFFFSLFSPKEHSVHVVLVP